MNKQFLKLHGQTLLDNGFKFVPIIQKPSAHPAAGKVPPMKGWSKLSVDQEMLEGWEDRYPKLGLGILTKHNPAVDIDCLDADASKYMRDFIENKYGFAPARIGRAPKILLLYRTDEPFTKVASGKYIDEWGDEQRVEILGDGQQFVAYGVHPKTMKEYEWTGVDSPLNTHAEMDLEVLTLEGARDIADEFDLYARAQGWTMKDKPMRGTSASDIPAAGSGEEDPDDWVTTDDVLDKWQGTVEELAELLEDLPPAEEYSAWVPVIAALKDAERHPDEFKELAHDWSARADNFDEDGFEDKWNNGNFTRTGNGAATISGILRKVEDFRMEQDIMQTVIPLFERALDLKQWDLAAERLRETPVFGTIRNHAVEVACDHYKRITGKKIPAATKKKALSVDFTQFDAPAWVEPWVFDQSANLFVNKTSMAKVVPHAFNNTHGADTADIGVTPEIFATVLRPIPVVGGVMYYPAMHGGMPDSKWKPVPGCYGEEFFRYNGQTWLNTFDPETLPAMPEKVSKKGLKAVDTVLNYFKMQFPDEKDYQYVMDWMAWVFNNPGQKINYALIILGCEGSGKTIVKKFFQYMLGKVNVGTVSNQVLHKSFSSWQAGHILKVIEEISVSGHRYDIMNILKEPISNEDLQIEKKGKDAVDQINTASYMAYTNDIAALPIKKGNSRFLIVQSIFKQREDLLEFMAAHPKFYKDFEKAFTKYAGEIRLWFKDWKYGDYFNHEERAPTDTQALQDMMDVAQDDFTNWLQDAIEDEDVAGISKVMIHAHAIRQNCPEKILPADRNIASRLAEMGFLRLGDKRYRARLHGKQGTIYVTRISDWIGYDGGPDVKKIQDHLQKQIDAVLLKDKDNWDD